MPRPLDFVKKLWFSAKNSLVGASALEPHLAEELREKLLSINLSRTRFFMILVFVMEAYNLFIVSPSKSHPGFESLFSLGMLLTMAVCALSVFLVSLAKARRFSRAAGHALLLGCWTLLLIASFIFCYGDFHEAESLLNFLLLTMAVSIVPLFDALASAALLSGYMAGGVVLAVSAHLSEHLIQQMIAVTILSFYASRLQLNAMLGVFSDQNNLRRANRELKLLSETDQLTGLLNRRGMEQRLREVIGPFRRRVDTLCVCMLDIDRFKAYNDLYLHSGGDDCLKAISSALLERTHRTSDMVVRYGGEEFIVASTSVAREDAVAFALGLKNAVEQLNIRFEYDGRAVVTISIGMTLYDTPGAIKNTETFLSDLILKADKELYNAKNNGRNCLSFEGTIFR